MRRINFVVPVGPDQQQILHVRLDQQIFQKIECRRVQPLQIVKKKSQRMIRPGEYADEPTKYQMKTTLRILRRNFKDRRLFSYNVAQFRNQVYNQLSVWI